MFFKPSTKVRNSFWSAVWFLHSEKIFFIIFFSCRLSFRISPMLRVHSSPPPFSPWIPLFKPQINQSINQPPCFPWIPLFKPQINQSINQPPFFPWIPLFKSQINQSINQPPFSPWTPLFKSQINQSINRVFEKSHRHRPKHWSASVARPPSHRVKSHGMENNNSSRNYQKETKKISSRNQENTKFRSLRRFLLIWSIK